MTRSDIKVSDYALKERERQTDRDTREEQECKQKNQLGGCCRGPVTGDGLG